MKLSYREKIGLLVVVVLVVIIVFIAWPIKTIRGNIKTHEAQRTEVQAVYKDTQRKIAQIPAIEGNINKIYDETKGLSEKFFGHVDNINLDKYFEGLLNKEPYVKGGKNQLEIVDKFTIDDAGDGEIPFYYYVPNVITYPILEAADTNGNLLETTDKALYDKVMNAVSMDEAEKQTVEVRTVSVPMKFTKEALLALEDELKSKETGVRISGVKIEDYTFGQVSEVPEDKGYSEGEVEFKFYTMQQIQKPDFSK